MAICRLFKINTFIFVLVLGFVSAAVAIPVRWTFMDTFFDDGGALTGSFVYDTDIGAIGLISDIMIVSSAGTTHPGHTYSSSDSDLRTNCSDDRFCGIVEPDVYGWSLGWVILFKMTNAGGIIPLESNGPYGYWEAMPGDDYKDHRWILPGAVVGEIVTVPEPRTMLLLGSGLVFIAGLGRKKLFKK